MARCERQISDYVQVEVGSFVALLLAAASGAMRAA